MRNRPTIGTEGRLMTAGGVSRMRSGTSLLMGAGSILLGFWVVAFFVLVMVYLQFLSWTRTSGQTWHSFIFHCRERLPMTILLGCTAASAALGVLGRRLVGGPAAPAPHSVGATAARFAKAGLVGAGLDSLIVLYIVGYSLLN